MVRIAEGCYEFFLAIGRKSPNRLPVKRGYRFGAAVRETVAFLGPGAGKNEDGSFASADGTRRATFEADRNTILFSLGNKQKRVRVE